MQSHQGGCLCGKIQYRVSREPLWVTACFCKFCQQASGTNGVVLPAFDLTQFEVVQGEPTQYSHISTGSGKAVNIHFCNRCGTKTHLTFERWPDRMGIYAGTFDDPGWFKFEPDNSKYIFVDEAVRGTMVPPGFKVFRQHAATAEGTPLEPEIMQKALHIR